MKKISRPEQTTMSSRGSKHLAAADQARKGPWEFNTASGTLFSLGTSDKSRRTAYRTATGELRFLPL